MKKNSVNYKKGKMDIDGVTGKFKRTNTQTCKKCCFSDYCCMDCNSACHPSTNIDEYVGEIPPPFGRGHFVRKEKGIRKYRGEYYKRVKEDSRKCSACPLLCGECRFGEPICYMLFSESKMDGKILKRVEPVKK